MKPDSSRSTIYSSQFLIISSISHVLFFFSLPLWLNYFVFGLLYLSTTLSGAWLQAGRVPRFRCFVPKVRPTIILLFQKLLNLSFRYIELKSLLKEAEAGCVIWILLWNILFNFFYSLLIVLLSRVIRSQICYWRTWRLRHRINAVHHLISRWWRAIDSTHVGLWGSESCYVLHHMC